MPRIAPLGLVAHTTLYIGFGRFNEIVGLEAAGGARP